MNTLSRLDSYLSSFFPFLLTASTRHTAVPPTAVGTPSTGPSTPDAGPSSSSTPPPNSGTFPTPPPNRRRLSNLPPRQRRHRRRQTYSSIKVPPPSTPLVLRIALVLWSILLSFWRSLVGETRAGRGRVKGRRAVGVQGRRGTGGGVGVLRELGERVMASAGIGGEEGEGEGEGEVSEEDVDEQGHPSDEGAKGWVDPVTRAPEGQDSLEDAPPGEDEFAQATVEDVSRLAGASAGHAKTQMDDRGHRDRSASPDHERPDPNFSFRLRSAARKDTDQLEERTGVTGARKPIPSFQRAPSPTSILSNPLSPPPSSKPPSPVVPAVTVAAPSPRRSSGARLLANPISTSLLDPSVPAPATNAQSSLFRKPSPKPIRPHPTTPFHLQKTLILDLDETLIHSTSRPLAQGGSGGGGILGLSLGGLVGKGKGKEGHTVEVVLNGRSTMYHVYKRPHVDHFLKKVASWYTLVIFTASMPEYADPVIDWLDGGRNLFAKKLYRDSCHLQPNGSYTKDLALVEQDLARVCFMDNSPVSYNWNKANALPIEGWTSDPNDEALLHSIPVLDSLRFVNDVRRVLGIRGFT
ncbi:hypothetical protein IAT38_005230 [Cryptococcus sp. DSM 104549]